MSSQSGQLAVMPPENRSPPGPGRYPSKKEAGEVCEFASVSVGDCTPIVKLVGLVGSDRYEAAMLWLRPPSSTHVSSALELPEYDPPVKQGPQHNGYGTWLDHCEQSHIGNESGIPRSVYCTCAPPTMGAVKNRFDNFDIDIGCASSNSRFSVLVFCGL